MTGKMVTMNYNNPVFLGSRIGTTTKVFIERFYQEVFFSITYFRMAKFTFNITNSQGVAFAPPPD